MKRPYLWLFVTIIIWPLIHLLVGLARFGGGLPQALFGEALAMLGMSVLAGGALIGLLQRAQNRTTRVSAVVGYLVLCPFAYAGALFSGLALGWPLVGTAVYGGIPLIVGTLVGYFLGFRVTE